MKYRTLFILCLLLLPASSHAARLYFTYPNTEVHVGDAISVTLMLDTEGEDVNAVEGAILLSENLKIAGVREENSIISLWVERPGSAGRSSSFSGLIPGGFRGVLSPFWEGVHAGAVYTLLIEATGMGEARITLGPSGRVFKNDGQGTVLPLTTDDATLTIRAGGATQAGIPRDTDLPEEFVPEVASSPEIFEGDFFAAFTASDTGSGIDHYEVAETRTAGVPASFERTDSPYRLKDQGLHSYVHVKAVDRAGNERIVTMPPAHPTPWYGSWWVAILVLALLLGAAVLLRRFHVR